MQRFTIRYTGLPGGEAVNVVHSDGVGVGDASAFAADLAACLDVYNSGQSSAVSILIDPLVTEIDIPTGEATAFHSVVTSPIVGGGSTEVLPSNLAMLIRLTTESVRFGRRVQGRVFLPGFTEDVSDAGLVSSASGNAVAAAWEGLVQTSGTDPRLVVYSRPLPSRIGAMSDVTGVSFWNQWAQLGRRRA